MSSRVTGVVTAVHVVENQFVNEGDLLIELDPADFNVALAQAEAQVTAETPNVPITVFFLKSNKPEKRAAMGH